MTLQRRLALTLVAVAVPLVAAIVWIRGELQRQSAEDTTRAFVQAVMEAEGRQRCEQNPLRVLGEPRLSFAGPPPGPGDPRGEPPRFGEMRLGFRPAPGEPPAGPRRERFLRLAPDRGGRPGPPRLFAYDASLRPADPAAPALGGRVESRLRGGATVASMRVDGELLVAVRVTNEASACAVVAVHGALPFREGRDGGLLASIALVSAGFLAAVWLAAGPVVRRLRALAGDVRCSAAGGYAEPVRVEGRDEVAELARAFNDAGREVRGRLEELHRREETLRGFLANTTHDLMLPLTVLQGHVARIKQQAEAGRADAQAARAAAEETEYLASLLHNLSAAAKLDAGEPLLQRHPVDLAALVERVVARHRPVASARGIEIGHAVPEQPLSVEGDVTLLEQAVSNLVHNAVRHNRDGGHVAVVLDADGEGFRLEVSDDGPGVAPDALPRLGERRFRTDEARQRQPQGLGIGLSIAREVAERHGLALSFAANQPAGLLALLRGPAAAHVLPP